MQPSGMLQLLFYCVECSPTIRRLHFSGGLGDFTLTMRSHMIE